MTFFTEADVKLLIVIVISATIIFGLLCFGAGVLIANLF